MKRLLEHTNLTGRNISMDRYFTSVPMSEWLLDRNVTLVGTMEESRVGIPHEIHAVGAREPKSTIYMYNSDNAKEKMLISWIDKRKRGSKNILCLTTMHDSVKVSRDIRKKPHPLVFYDKTKGGVDIVDYVSGFLSTRMKSKRWTMNAFCYTLDTEWTNARTLHDEVKNVRTPNFHFTWDLGESLVLPQVQRRYAEQQQHLRKVVLTKICSVLGVKYVSPNFAKPVQNEKGRCHVCLDNTKGQADFRKNTDKLSNKSKTSCHVCNMSVCLNHSSLKCDKCRQEEEED